MESVAAASRSVDVWCLHRTVDGRGSWRPATGEQRLAPRRSLVAGALFIPSLALALGIWSGGSKTFEVIYVVWWYIGPAHQIPGLDFMGTTAASSSPAVYSMAAVLLLMAAYWRRRQSMGYA